MSNAFDKASLVMLPHAYEEGKVYSLKPTDRSGDFTFSRGTDTATRVGEDGYIKKEYQNLLLRSNEFDNSYWVRNNATLTSGQSGYDGSSDAFKVDFTGGTLSYIRRQETFSFIGTISFYFKAGTHNYIQILNSPSGNHYANFDISNGETGNKGSLIIDSNITDVGNGWYRCSMTADFSSQTIFFVWAVNSLTSGWADVVSTSGNYYIQDAQINQGLVAYPYLETTTAPVYGGLTDDMPRLDYSGGATCPSLLLEPSRSNLISHSEYRSNGTNASVYNNSTLSPEGLQNACLFVEDTALNVHGIQYSNVIPTNASAVNYTISVFAKAKERSHIQLSFYADSTTYNSSFFDISEISNGTIGDPSTHKIEDYGNGWYRCSFTANVTQSTGSYNLVRFMMSTGSSGYYTGDGTSGLYMYGLQVEAGSYPTSYIPTYGSSQTRAGEAPPFPNAFTFDNLGAGESGTFAFKFKVNGKDGVFRVFSQGGSGTWFWNGTTLTIYTTSGSFNFNMFDNINDSVGDTFHICFRKNNNLLTLFVNGQESNTRDMGTDNFSFFSHISTYTSSQSVMQMTQYDTALSNSECIALTTL